MIQTIPKLFNVEVDQSEQNRAQAWCPPQLANWIRGKEALMDVPTHTSLSLVWSAVLFPFLPVMFSLLQKDTGIVLSFTF